MTKKSDMASRYAAAHARREARHRQNAPREYLPLAEEAPQAAIPATSSKQGVAERIRMAGRGNAPVVSSRLPAINYSYLRGDLTRTAVLAVILFAAMILLHFVIK